MQTTKAILNT